MTIRQEASPVTADLPKHERRFYSRTAAFGRFGLRQFTPQVMDMPHWHGHVECNFCEAAEMVYDFNGTRISVPPETFVLFWAGVPHQLLEVNQRGAARPRLSNIYLPADMFLLMPHIAQLQLLLMSAAFVRAAPALVGIAQLDRWYADYRSGEFERTEVVKMELNALFRRMLLYPLTLLHAPGVEGDSGVRQLSSAHIRQVVDMTRFILENLERPIHNADVAAVIGFHENYATSLFSRVMRMPIKKFVIRMRLMRARALLIESTLPIAQVAEEAGFSSLTQFYAHFARAYGMSPASVRVHYVQKELR
ncbi:helix-turn-helix domain-containing protein [Tropicimonas sp.]|uniref:helix-turn-helix domain-containing protein n=1 Tax=Tropicimonas sp. TaxID=2067044 RepID=UPI003A884D2F